MRSPTTRIRLGRSVLLGILIGSVAPVYAVLAPVQTATAAVATSVRSVAMTPTQRAWNWVIGQQASTTVVTSASTISAERTYPASWTGRVTGTFTPVGVTSPVDDPAALSVDAPASVSGAYRGILTGHVRVQAASGRWIVQVYRDTAAGRSQVPLQALAAADGSFSVDLRNAPPQPTGTWALGLLDATNSYAPYGATWPAVSTYHAWSVQALVVTDTEYLVDEQPARADNTFSFSSSRAGTKVFRLVDNATGAVLAEQSPAFGLVRSFAGENRTYTYDQALALVTAVSIGADASSLTTGLLALQRSDGSFVDSADARNPSAGGGDIRTGVTAIATYALLRRVATMPAADSSRGTVIAAARQGVGWLRGLQRADGLIPAGFDAGSASPTRWVSTEHDVDAWQTLHLAASVLSDGAATAAARTLASGIVTTLWDPTTQRFLRGVDENGNPDATDALDASSWGSLFLRSAGFPQLADEALEHTDAFMSSVSGASGFRSYYPQAIYPHAPANVWVEGSAGVALAFLRSGNTASSDAVLDQLVQRQRADGSFPYAAVPDAATDMTDASSVAATTWYVLASVAHNGPTIWD